MGTEAFGGIAVLLFLPAFVRLLGFLLIGLWSIPALFLAALICVDLSLSVTSQIIVSLFLAVGAPLGLLVSSRLIGVTPTLNNLNSTRLLVLSVAAALGSGTAYHTGLTIVGAETHSAGSFFTAAFGDAAGTWVVIYAIKILLMLVSKVVALRPN